MATKRQKQKAYKVAKKTAKKYPILFLFIVIILIGIGVGVFILYNNGYFDKWFNKGEDEKKIVPLSVNGEVQLYSIEMRKHWVC